MINLFYTHLCEAQFDAPLFEELGKLFQFLQVAGLLHSGRVQPLGCRLSVGQGLDGCGCCCAGWSGRLQQNIEWNRYRAEEQFGNVRKYTWH